MSHPDPSTAAVTLPPDEPGPHSRRLGLVAVIATFGAQVVDSFYVKDMFGLKFHSPAKQRALERKLRQAISEGVEQAIS